MSSILKHPKGSNAASARDAILAVAARHFADHGFSGASLREIMRDARVNPASVHYHFGSKEAVYRATVAPYLTRLCDERMAALQQLQQVPGQTPMQRIEQLIRAYVEPHVRLCNEPAALHYVRLLARFITENDQVTESIYTEFLAPVRGAYWREFSALVPQIPEPTLARLFSFMVTLMVTAPADSSYESLTGKSPWPTNTGELTDQLVAFIAAGFAEAATRFATAPQARKRSTTVKQHVTTAEASARKQDRRNTKSAGKK